MKGEIMNNENLIPMNKRTKKEQREIAVKGGEKSVRVRREKKLLRETLEEALSIKTKTGNKYIDITTALIKQAENGNVRAYEVIRDTLGQKNSEKDQKIDNNITIKVVDMDGKELFL